MNSARSKASTRRRKPLQRHGPAIVLLGKHGGVSSQLPAPSSMTYLFVHLKAGESWSYQPPADHTVSWVALSYGEPRGSR